MQLVEEDREVKIPDWVKADVPYYVMSLVAFRVADAVGPASNVLYRRSEWINDAEPDVRVREDCSGRMSQLLGKDMPIQNGHNFLPLSINDVPLQSKTQMAL